MAKIKSIFIKDQKILNYVNTKPNFSYYINQLILKDMNKEKENREYIDKKIEELKKYIDSNGNSKDNQELKNSLKNFI